MFRTLLLIIRIYTGQYNTARLLYQTIYMNQQHSTLLTVLLLELG